MKYTERDARSRSDVGVRERSVAAGCGSLVELNHVHEALTSLRAAAAYLTNELSLRVLVLLIPWN